MNCTHVYAHARVMCIVNVVVAAASFDQQAAFYPYEYYPVFPAYVAQPPMVQQPTMASPEDFPPLPSAYGSNLHGQGLLGEQPAALLPFPVVHPVVEELSEEMAGVMAQPEIAFGYVGVCGGYLCSACRLWCLALCIFGTCCACRVCSRVMRTMCIRVRVRLFMCREYSLCLKYVFVSCV